MTEPTDEILVRRALEGDPACFATLCQRYYPSLVAIAHAVTGDEHLAEDAAQEAVAEACRRLRTLRKPQRFGAWLGAALSVTALASVPFVLIASPNIA